MKHKVCFVLCTFMMLALSASAQGGYPNGQTLYFLNAAGSLPVKVEFYSDKENDAVCSVLNGYQTLTFKFDGSRGEWFTFVGYTLGMRYRAVQSPYGGLPMTVPDGVGKDFNDQTLFLSHDYDTLVLNGTTYNRRISQSQFSQLYNQVYGNAPSASPGSGGGGSYQGGSVNDNGHNSQSSTCKYCHGMGRCSSCNGKGYKYNTYSGTNDVCPSCRGNGRCFNCYGTGRQR